MLLDEMIPGGWTKSLDMTNRKENWKTTIIVEFNERISTSWLLSQFLMTDIQSELSAFDTHILAKIKSNSF